MITCKHYRINFIDAVGAVCHSQCVRSAMFLSTHGLKLQNKLFSSSHRWSTQSVSICLFCSVFVTLLSPRTNTLQNKPVRNKLILQCFCHLAPKHCRTSSSEISSFCNVFVTSHQNLLRCASIIFLRVKFNQPFRHCHSIVIELS